MQLSTLALKDECACVKQSTFLLRNCCCLKFFMCQRKFYRRTKSILAICRASHTLASIPTSAFSLKRFAALVSKNNRKPTSSIAGQNVTDFSFVMHGASMFVSPQQTRVCTQFSGLTCGEKPSGRFKSALTTFLCQFTVHSKLRFVQRNIGVLVCRVVPRRHRAERVRARLLQLPPVAARQLHQLRASGAFDVS